jgi:hypothetical protein
MEITPAFISERRFRHESLPCRILRLSICGIFLLSLSTLSYGQTKIEVTDPVIPLGVPFVAPGVLDLTFTATADLKMVRILITAPGDNSKVEITLDPAKREYSQSINLLNGRNQIQLLGFKDGDKTAIVNTAPLDITCSGKKCGGGSTSNTGAVTGVGGGGSDQTKADNVTIKAGTPNNGSVDAFMVVKKSSQIQKLTVVVYNSATNLLVDSKSAVTLTDVGDSSIASTTLKVASGRNVIRVIDADKPTEKANEALVEVNCAANCSTVDNQLKPAPAGTVHINSPPKDSKPYNVYNEKTVPLGIRLDPASTVAKVTVKVVNNGVAIPQPVDTFDMPDGTKPSRDKGIDLKIAGGLNRVTVFDPANPDTQLDYVDINCVGGGCGTTGTGKISLVFPEDGADAQGNGSIDVGVIVAQQSDPNNKISNIRYRVVNGDKTSGDSPPRAVGDISSEAKKLTMRVPVVAGNNIVTFYDADKPGDLSRQVTLTLTCPEDTCASDFGVATVPSNSRFTRAIVGIEQAGASSAESKSNPFLDFFFTTPLLFSPMKEFVQVIRTDSHGNPVLDANNQPVKDWVRQTALGPDGQPLKSPRFGAWGQVRFSTTPEQTSSFAVFPSNFVNQVSDPTKVVDLVKSFDFLAGLEYRAFNANGWIWTLIPGVKQRTSVYFTFGGGAISPLSVKRESAQLFIVPVVGDPRRAEFIRRFGDPQSLTYVGFVPLERDRFFRQYYAGIRLKTHYCDDADCKTYRNRFPSIVDFAIGQNEAVTGGRLKAEVRDSANNVIAHRRAWVARVDAFFPLPFREANFLYLYGTALMKIGGGGGVKIQTPLFLDTPTSTVQITDVNVYIPPPDLQPTRIDRDYYKIGIGVNLTDLFNRNKPKQ